MAQRDYIPIDVDDLPEQFELDIDDVTYNFGINYNEVGDFYTVDLYDEDMEPIVLGEKMVLDHPLWNSYADKRLPLRDIVPMDESGQAKAVNSETLGKIVFLFFDDLSPEEDMRSPDYVGIGLGDDTDDDDGDEDDGD
ncbi:phage baseplate plug protein [Lactiplantibacillus xiangfangensis]|uniref:phage baseplate plug family protein n=1 Tax=Lactiplantibacillus xiangfangensis TaxID=942150 RepID=UPI00384F61C5